MEDCSSLVSGHGFTARDVEKSKMKMKMKETVVSKDLRLSRDSIHRRPWLVLGPNKLPRPDFARTNMASNDSFDDRMMNSGVYPCRFCSEQFLSYKAQVGHHAAHEHQLAYEKNSRESSSFRNNSTFGPDSTLSRQAIYQSCSSSLRARFEFMNQKKPLKTPWTRPFIKQKKPLTPWTRPFMKQKTPMTPCTRSLGFRLNHGRLQSLQQELAMRNKWVHLHRFTSTPGFEQTDNLSLELTIGRSNDIQRAGPAARSRFLNARKASADNIFMDHSGLDLTLKL